MILAMSDVAITGIFGLAIATVGGTVTLLVTLLTKEAKKQNEATEKTVSEFEEAWEERGRLVMGYKEDNELLHTRVDELNKRCTASEERERRCLEGYEHLLARQAVLEAKLGVNLDDGHPAAGAAGGSKDSS